MTLDDILNSEPPTGIPTPYGDLPRSETTILWGSSTSGVSNVAANIAAHAQGDGHTVLWVDPTHSLTPGTHGTDPHALIHVPLSDATAAMSVMHTLTATGGIDLVVIDDSNALTAGVDDHGESLRALSAGLASFHGEQRNRAALLVVGASVDDAGVEVNQCRVPLPFARWSTRSWHCRCIDGKSIVTKNSAKTPM